ncbi:hypothetical protein [Sphingomonas sp. PWP1-2]|uniref:hypothetical protein n=1 Tax=Sphingomonas sp. PWP1-2 TaxID=2804558 RepID=UPI003CF3EEC2
MGVPYHTSRDVPGRCLWLIDRLFAKVQTITAPHEADLGPLDATFLFAMSTLILTLPIERLERHRRKEALGLQGYMDDRPLDPLAAKEIDAVLGSDATAFNLSPFYIPGAWSFASVKYEPDQNLAREFPEELADGLSAQEAKSAAEQLSARAWMNCLRNALAHGGIVYLDAEGRQTNGQPTRMMGFVSAEYGKEGMRKPPDRLIALRTTPDAYRATLERWVCWVQGTGLSEALAA